MMVTNQVKNQHLLWRSAFGPMVENARELKDVSQMELYQLLVETSSKKPETIFVAENAFDGLVKGVQDIVKLETLTKEQKQKIRKQSRDDLKSLNLKWLGEMVNSEAQLREKMSLFWHGHLHAVL